MYALVSKRSIFCDVKQWRPLKVDQRFGGTYRLLLHGRRISQGRYMRWPILANCFPHVIYKGIKVAWLWTALHPKSTAVRISSRTHTDLLALCWALAYPQTLKVEATCFSETKAFIGLHVISQYRTPLKSDITFGDLRALYMSCNAECFTES
jgi:hypothetical protein